MKHRTFSISGILLCCLLIGFASACATRHAAAPPAGQQKPQDAPLKPGPDAAPSQVLPAVVATTGWPAAFVSEPEHDFGTVVDGTKIVHAFTLENQGEAPLRITEITTGCACAVPEYPKVIFPGQKGDIILTIDTNGYGGREFIREIMVSTNEPNNAMLKLLMHGNISLFTDITPKSLILKGPANEKVQAVSTITPFKEYPFSITGFELDDALKEAVSVEIARDGGQFIITATNKLKTPGQYLGKMVIKTDSPLKPEMKLFIRGTIR